MTLVEALGTLAEGEAPARLCLAPSLARRIAESARNPGGFRVPLKGSIRAPLGVSIKGSIGIRV